VVFGVSCFVFGETGVRGQLVVLILVVVLVLRPRPSSLLGSPRVLRVLLSALVRVRGCRGQQGARIKLFVADGRDDFQLDDLTSEQHVRAALDDGVLTTMLA
jgi:hypothetical protein